MLRSRPLELPAVYSKPLIRSVRALPLNVKSRFAFSTEGRRYRVFKHAILALTVIISIVLLLQSQIRVFFGQQPLKAHGNTFLVDNSADSDRDSAMSDEFLPNLRDASPIALGHSYSPPRLSDAVQFDSGSLAAILPVTRDSIGRLEHLLDTLLSDRSHVSAIGLVLKVDLLPILHDWLASTAGDTYLDIMVAAWHEDSSEASAMMKLASEMITEYVLIMGYEGLSSLDRDSQTQLLAAPLLLDTISGLCGGQSMDGLNQATCVFPAQHPKNSSFLLPPFVLPSFPIRGFNFTPSHGSQLWKELSAAFLNDVGYGTVVQESGKDTTKIWCQKQCLKHGLAIDDSAFDECLAASKETKSKEASILDAMNSSSLAIILSTIDDLTSFSAAACRFIKHGISVHVLILSHTTDEATHHDNSFPWLHDHLSSNVCEISYSALHSSINDHANAEAVSFWLQSANETMSAIIYGLSERSNSILQAELDAQTVHGTALIKIPQTELSFCDWIGSLSLSELRNWNTPEIEIAVITDDRPKSLARLLRSLQAAYYFGDTVNIRINVEQTADTQTREFVDDFNWEHGHTFVHHRVVHAGLLTAIVESWYPRSNDSYGILLEDDVEVSPLYYAWTKMALLRYRYGSAENSNPSLFGISLYQQKQNELRPEGRRPFNAQTVFDSYGLYYRDSPYLSQVPCSWGAVYFPEHWREFHSYLMVRFSEAWLPIGRHAVPHVRSNRWAKSWKRFFIELVFLRGYVMLYPNYDDFVSLSTNHLEIGSHVREEPRSVYDQKKALFTLPLMDLSSSVNSEQLIKTGLLDMPKETLPAWNDLPVLDLLGALSSSAEIESRGREGQETLAGCRTVGSTDSRNAFVAEDLFTCTGSTR